MVLLALSAPIAMTLFLLLMQRLEAALFPARIGAVDQPPADVPPADLAAAPEDAAGGTRRAA